MSALPPFFFGSSGFSCGLTWRGLPQSHHWGTLPEPLPSLHWGILWAMAWSSCTLGSEWPPFPCCSPVVRSLAKNQGGWIQSQHGFQSPDENSELLRALNKVQESWVCGLWLVRGGDEVAIIIRISPPSMPLLTTPKALATLHPQAHTLAPWGLFCPPR